MQKFSKNTKLQLYRPGGTDIGPARKTAEFLIGASLSGNTVRAYRRALRDLDDWLNRQGLELNDQSLSEYIGHLFERGNAVASAQVVVAAACKRAGWSRLPSPKGYLTKAAMSGYRRQAVGRGRGQAKGLRHEDVMQILDHPSIETRDKAIVSLLWCAAMRVSEVVALTCGDVEPTTEGCLVRIRRSKTDQDGDGMFRYLKGEFATNVLSRVEAVTAHPLGSLESPVIGLQANQMRKRLKDACEVAGLEGHYTCHSGRVGFAQELTAREAPTHEIMNGGGWKTASMVAHYSKAVDAEQGVVARYL